MTTHNQETVTQLLQQAADGESKAAADLLPLVYTELRALAGGYFGNERRNHTLQPTALVHEAYLKLVDQTNIHWRSRQQFFVLAARAMRNVLVDHARGRNRAKRGGDWKRVTLDVADGQIKLQDDGPDMVAIDQALQRLAQFDERKAQLVELRFFAGLTSEDAAQVLGISRTTASEEWRMARAWLHRELRDAAL